MSTIVHVREGGGHENVHVDRIFWKNVVFWLICEDFRGKYIYLKGQTVPKKLLKIRNSTQTISKNFQVFRVKATSRPRTHPKFLQVWQTVPKSNSHLFIDLFTPEEHASGA